MKSLNTLYKQAKNDYPNLHIDKITLNAWQDKNACASFSGYLEDNRIVTGRFNRNAYFI